MKTSFKAWTLACLVSLPPLAFADSVVVFHVPVKLEKLDPTVKSALLYCYVQGPNNWNVVGTSPLMIISNGGYDGTTSVSVSVKPEDLGKPKTWSCVLRFKQNTDVSNGGGVYGPNVAGQPWTNVMPGYADQVSGNF